MTGIDNEPSVWNVGNERVFEFMHIIVDTMINDFFNIFHLVLAVMDFVLSAILPLCIPNVTSVMYFKKQLKT